MPQPHGLLTGKRRTPRKMKTSPLDVDGGREQCPQSKFGVMTGPAVTAITAARIPYIIPKAINVKLFYNAFVVLAPIFNGMMLLVEP